MRDKGRGRGESRDTAVEPGHDGRDRRGRHEGDDDREQLQVRREGHCFNDSNVERGQEEEAEDSDECQIADLITVESSLQAGPDDDEHEGHAERTGIPANRNQGLCQPVARAGPRQRDGGKHANEGRRDEISQGAAPLCDASEGEHPYGPEADSGTKVKDKKISEGGGRQAVLNDEDGKIDEIVHGTQMHKGAPRGGIARLHAAANQQADGGPGNHEAQGQGGHHPKGADCGRIEVPDNAVEDEKWIKDFGRDPAPAVEILLPGIVPSADQPTNSEEAEKFRDGGENDGGGGQGVGAGWMLVAIRAAGAGSGMVAEIVAAVDWL